ncbi:hypothetical protein [Methylocystis echinoides]|jgi:hypothetical protein|uniref:hypothetical protein n=1 Tax=Methylocystis echinoides TaxID=29468 RepID=UPI00341EC41E
MSFVELTPVVRPFWARAVSTLPIFGVLAFSVSGLLLAVSTYKAAKDRDWPAALIGVALTCICVICVAWLVLF